MPEQITINLPEGLTLAKLLPAAAEHGNYATEITEQEPREESLVGKDAMNARIQTLQQTKGVRLDSMYRYDETTDTYTIQYTQEVTKSNPLTKEEFGKKVIEKAFKDAYVRMVRAKAQQEIQQAANAQLQAALQAAEAELEGGSIA